MTRLKMTSSVIVLGAALSALAVASCNQNTPANSTTVAAQAPALPLTTADTPQSAPAPLPTTLPAAAPARVVRLADQRQRYAYADRAYRYARVLGDAPPDYTFDYDGVRPYVWNSSGGYRYSEPTPAGERSYYFDPSSNDPYLVRDGGYAYGFDRGQLVVVYDSQGRVMDPAYVGQRADIAGRYLARARALRDAARRSQRQQVAAQNWEHRRAEVEAERARWEAQQNQEADWRAYHDEHDAQQRAYWQAEQDRRAAEAGRYREATSRAFNDGRAVQAGQDGGAAAATAAALAAAAAAYNAGRHDDRRARPAPPPFVQPPVVGPAAPPPGSPPPGPRQGRQGEDRGAFVPGGQAGQGGQDLRARRQAEDQARQAAAQQASSQQAAQQAAAAQQQAAARAQAEQQQQRSQQEAARQAGEQQRHQRDAAAQAARQQAEAQQKAQADAAKLAVDQQRAQQHAAEQAARQATEAQHRAQQEAAKAQEAAAKAQQAAAKAAAQPKPAAEPVAPAPQKPDVKRRRDGEPMPPGSERRGAVHDRTDKQEP